MKNDDNKNLILATVLSGLVILVWMVFFPPQEPVQDPNATPSAATSAANTQPVASQPTASTGEAAIASAAPVSSNAEAPRISIDTPRLGGSISLEGGRIDDLVLRDYRLTLEDGSPNVTLLRPEGQAGAYYALFGWAPGGDLGFDDVPTPNTVWTQVGSGDLGPDTPVVLEWANSKGQIFRRTYAVDENFLFTVKQEVENTGASSVRMAPYSELVRVGEPNDLKGFFVIHEGAIRQSGEELNEFSYGDLRDLDADPLWGASSEVTEVTQNGWVGFTDHYWMTTLIPTTDAPFTSVLQYQPGGDRYKTIARLGTVDLAAGQTTSVSTQLFAGAKEWEAIRNYENDGGIYKFLDSIDWGWFFFLTKPIFSVLHWLNELIGNMGWSIIGLTLLIKAILFPLAYKSYVSMAKMKELQPQMEKLKEQAGDDRQKLQQAMMQLYKKEKVNPASGCLPILLQIPIFFSLYKVIFVTIELRHAPWIGWIQDLSAPDPSSILNLFGLLPWSTPEQGSLFFILSLGILPIILGVSMWLQQKLNPAPTDPTQKMIFAWMPWIFMFMLGSFASGLVIYWIANNIITFTQQYIIMRSQGYKPDILGNITSGFKRTPKDKG